MAKLVVAGTGVAVEEAMEGVDLTRLMVLVNQGRPRPQQERLVFRTLPSVLGFFVSYHTVSLFSSL
jgi:hypothetical protein